MCTRERALYMSEKLAFEKFFRDRRAIDLHQWIVGPRTAHVNRMGNKLLADARLSLYENGRRRLGDGLDAFEHAPQRRTRAYDPAEVHRNIHFLTEVVALALQFLAKARVLGQRPAELSLRAVALGDVLGRYEHAVDFALRIVVRDCGHDEIHDLAVLGHHLALEIIEGALPDKVFELSVGICSTIRRAEKISNRPPHDFVPGVAQLLQPVIRNGHYQPGGIDRVQHGRRRTVQGAVFEIDSRLVRYLRVHGNGAQERALAVELDKGVRHAVDDFARTRDKAHWFVFQLAHPPQRRSQFLGDTPRTFGRREFVWPMADHFPSLIPQALEHRVIDVEVYAVFGNRRCHDRRLAKQPLIVVLGDHAGMIYEIS